MATTLEEYTWASAKTEEENKAFIQRSIKLSEMVGQGRLSATAAKQVFSQLYDAHKKNLGLIKQIDELL